MHASCVLGWTQNQFSKCINHSRFQIVEYMLTRRLEWFFIWILNDQHFYYISHNIIQIHTTCKRLYLLGKKEKKNYVLCSLAVLMLRWYIFQTCRHIFFFKKYIIFLIVFFKDCVTLIVIDFFGKKMFWLLSRIFSSSARPFSCLAQIKFRIFLHELLVVVSMFEVYSKIYCN